MNSFSKIKRGIYGLVIAMLLMPLLQSTFKFVKIEKLSGSFVEEDFQRPKLSTTDFSTGVYQTDFEAYWQDKFGFKNLLIRINNQFNFSVFNKTNARNVIVGSNDMLLPEPDIKSYLGEDFVGIERMKSFVEKLRYVQDTLEKLNKGFFVIVAPSKASIYPENIPSKYFEIYQSNNTNYEAFKQEVEKQNINVFDSKEIIMTGKEYKKYATFPKYGVHWSGNTVAHLSDTLLRFIERFSAYKMPVLEISEGEKTVLNYRYTDYDIGESMNLLWHNSDEELHYPKIEFYNVPKYRPNLLGVGDSFIQSFWGFYPILDTSFSLRSNLWYYNKILGWPKKYSDNRVPTIKLDLEIEVRNRDLIVLEMTEENLKQLGFGFIDDLHSHFKGENQLSEDLMPLYNRLINDPIIEEEANNLYAHVGYTKEEMVKSLAKSQLKNQWLIDFNFDLEVEKVINAIQADSNWLSTVKEKAIQNNITIKEAVKRDAIWVVNDKLGLN